MHKQSCLVCGRGPTKLLVVDEGDRGDVGPPGAKLDASKSTGGGVEHQQLSRQRLQFRNINYHLKELGGGRIRERSRSFFHKYLKGSHTSTKRLIEIHNCKLLDIFKTLNYKQTKAD